MDDVFVIGMNQPEVNILIDEHVTCEVPEDPELRKTVQELQTHTCTKTCKKKGPECRFGFPRLPSKNFELKTYQQR